MTIEVKNMPELNVAYLRHTGSYHKIGEAFNKIFEWAGENNHLSESTVGLGIYWDDPSCTPEETLRSDACITVPDGTRTESPFESQTVPSGEYAVYHTRVKPTGFQAAWNKVFEEWLPTSGYTYDDRPCYEMYLNDCSKDPEGMFTVNICVPVFKNSEDR